MATTLIKSAEVAVEPTYCNLDPATGIPYDTGLTFYAAEISDRSQVIQVGEPVLTDRNSIARDGLYEMPPEPATVSEVGGDPIPRRQGTFSLRMPLRGIGTGTEYDSWAKLPLWNLVLTGLEQYRNATIGTDVVATAGTTTSHTCTAAAKFTIGNMIKAVINGRSEFSGVSDIAGSVLTYSPALSAAAALGSTIYPMIEAVIPQKGVPTVQSVACRLNGIGWQAIAYGCKAQSIGFEYAAETGRLELVVGMYTPFVAYSDTTDDTVPIKYADGGVLHHLNSYFVVGNTGGTVASPLAAPAADSVTTPCLDAFSLTVNITHSPVGCGESIVGVSDMEVVDYSVDGSITFANVNLFNNDLWEGLMRNVLIGFTSGDPSLPGECGCIFIPAAVVKNDTAKRDEGKGHYRRTVTFGVGYYAGDDSAVDPANSLFRLALGDFY